MKKFLFTALLSGTVGCFLLTGFPLAGVSQAEAQTMAGQQETVSQNASVTAKPAPITLRALVTVNSPLVRLSDIFTGIQPGNDPVLGNAPAPGQRVVADAQVLNTIAADYNLTWRAPSPYTELILSRAGVLLPLSALKKTLHEALTDQGAPKYFRIILNNLPALMIPPGSKPDIIVEQLTYVPNSGFNSSYSYTEGNPYTEGAYTAGQNGFHALIGIRALGISPVSLSVYGFIEPEERVLVTAKSLQPGEIISPQDITFAEMPAFRVGKNYFTSERSVIGMQVTNFVSPGTTLNAQNLSLPLLVNKGQAVTLRLEEPGLMISAEGIALQNGSKGDLVEVLNPVSHAVILGTVNAAGVITVIPGSLPVDYGLNGVRSAVQ